MENTDRTNELKRARVPIEETLTSVLRNLSGSRGELNLPEAVIFPSGVRSDSFPEKDVEKVIRDGVEKGEIFFGVDPNFKGQTFEVKRVKAGIGVVILGLFPENFIAKCDESGIRTDDAIKRCLARVILEDMRVNAERHPRGAIGRSHSSLVGIFNARIT